MIHLQTAQSARWRGTLQFAFLLVAFAIAIPSQRTYGTHDSAWVRSQVAALDLTDAERAWEKIHWVPRLDEALALSQRTQRPLLILTYYGDLDGRC